MKTFLLAMSLLAFQANKASSSRIGTSVASIDFPFVDESRWADESVPVDDDTDLANLVEMYNAPEPWDHY